MVALLADAFVKATVILLLAAAVTLVLRRSTAALRHFVWALACGGILILPLATALLPDVRVAAWPRLDVPVAFHAEQTASVPQPGPAPSEPVALRSAAAPAPTTTVAQDAVRLRLTTDWTAYVFPVWLGGVGIVLFLLAVGTKTGCRFST